jgi:hypothetical protein
MAASSGGNSRGSLIFDYRTEQFVPQRFIATKRVASSKKSSKSKGSSEPHTKREPTVRYALCISNDGYPASLEVRKVYQVLFDPKAACHKLIRVIDESAEDYLFPQDLFISISLPKEAEAAFQS